MVRLPALTNGRRRAAVGLAAFAVAAGLTAAAMAVPAGTVRYRQPAPVLVPIVQTPDPVAALPAPSRMARLSLAEPDAGPGPPTETDPALIEVGSEGRLPRIGADGRQPLTHYARPSAVDCLRPCVAVLVTGLGLVDRLTDRALALPAAVALSFSPYAGAAAWQARARASGHEVLLGLPLEPANRHDDAGPLAVRAGQPESDLAAALRRVLAQGSGYVGVDADAGAFAVAPGPTATLVAELRARGLGLVERGGAALAASAGNAGLPYLGSAPPVDREPTPEAIDAALADVAAAALRDGRALAVAGPLPAAFDRIAAWLDDLPRQGIALVPPSRLLLTGSDPTLARQ